MEKAFDESSVTKTLRDGIIKGYWTIEDLDIPPDGWIATSKTDQVIDSGARSALRVFPVRTYKNLLRELDPREIAELEEIGRNFKAQKEGNANA